MSSVNVQFVAKSRNEKTGPIPVTTSDRNTCPTNCKLRDNGCYASAGYYTRLNWDKVTDGTRGGSWFDLCDKIKALPDGAIWRHNVAGDLPHNKQVISMFRLADLVKANQGKRGFAYTHHDMTKADNRAAIEWSNRHGFTVNLSADNPAQADELADLSIAPVVTIVAADQSTNCKTPQGRDIVICPAVTREDVTCKTCQLCSKARRSVIVGFPAHGTQKGKIKI